MNFECKSKVLATKVDKRNGFSLVFLRDSRHDKKADKWISSPYPNVHFAGKAHTKIDSLIGAIDEADKFPDGNSKGVYIFPKDTSFTNEVYEKEDGTKIYPKQITVWDWEFAGTSSSNDDNSQETVEPSSGDLPF